MSNGICGAVWSDTEQPCEYGSTTDHVCYNAKTCTGAHMCACEAVPLYVQDWIDAHADEGEEWLKSFDAAGWYLYTDTDGAVVCQCCGVNYNPEVDRD